MAWFALALVGPFLYAVTNYIDKLVLERYFTQGGVGTILIFSALFSAVTLPFLFLIDPTVFRVSAVHLVALSGVGLLNALVLFFYLKAIQSDEVSVAIIFYQLVPVLAYGLGYLILGETLSSRQIVAMLVIVLGACVISFDLDAQSQFRLRSRTVLYMLGASFCWALGAALFKAVALEEQVVRSLFWENAALAVIGTSLFIFARSYRAHFLIAFRENSRAILSLNALNETIYIAANVVMAFAYMLAPVSAVLLANSYQALFALVIGAALTIFTPEVVVERMHPHHLGQKVLAIMMTAFGTYLLVTPGY